VTEVRTLWAERQAEELLSVPFIAGFVFRSPQMIDASQKEVADLLVLHKGTGLLVSQKAQEDPESRGETKNELWVHKAAKSGVKQLLGALRPSTKPIWCDHSQRGRVDFPDGLPPIVHGLVTVETFRPVDLQPSADQLPLLQENVPITYISLNDFLNVALQLRTVPELVRYLNARRVLPEAALRNVGAEQAIFEYYLLHGTLERCPDHEHARAIVAARAEELKEILEQFEEYHLCSGHLEYVANALATRHAACLDGLPAHLVAHFDAPSARQNYLLMQEVLADLRLLERAALGRQFERVIEGLNGRLEGYVQATAHLDSRPEWIFMFARSKGVPREVVLSRIETTMRAALSFYQKEQCMVVIDRDGESYEVAITRPEQVFKPSVQDITAGQKLFSSLRTTSIPLEGF
jgi:hypothetical protein